MSDCLTRSPADGSPAVLACRAAPVLRLALSCCLAASSSHDQCRGCWPGRDRKFETLELQVEAARRLRLASLEVPAASQGHHDIVTVHGTACHWTIS